MRKRQPTIASLDRASFLLWLAGLAVSILYGLFAARFSILHGLGAFGCCRLVGALAHAEAEKAITAQLAERGRRSPADAVALSKLAEKDPEP